MAVERVEHLGILMISDARAILFPVCDADNRGFFNRSCNSALTHFPRKHQKVVGGRGYGVSEERDWPYSGNKSKPT